MKYFQSLKILSAALLTMTLQQSAFAELMIQVPESGLAPSALVDRGKTLILVKTVTGGLEVRFYPVQNNPSSQASAIHFLAGAQRAEISGWVRGNRVAVISQKFEAPYYRNRLDVFNTSGQLLKSHIFSGLSLSGDDEIFVRMAKNRIIAGSNALIGNPQIIILNGSLSVTQQEVTSSNLPTVVGLSEDGNRLFMNPGGTISQFYSVANNELEEMGFFFLTPYISGVRISKNGETSAWTSMANDEVRVSRWNPVSQSVQTLTEYTAPTYERILAIDLSQDGKILAVGTGYFGDNLGLARIRVKNLETGAILLDHLAGAAVGNIYNNVKSLSLSPKGNVLVAGLLGDEHATSDNVLTFFIGNDQAAFQDQSEGSIQDTQIAGKYFSISKRTAHSSISSGGGPTEVHSIERVQR